MEIVSISLDRESRNDIESMMKALGMKSRSRLVRTALSSLLNEYRAIEKLEGRQTAVFMVTHVEGRKADMGSFLHRFGHVIKTNMHHHSGRGCLDIFIAEGDAEEIKEMFSRIKGMDGVGNAFCSII